MFRSGRPGNNPGATQEQPGSNPGATREQPGSNPGTPGNTLEAKVKKTKVFRCFGGSGPGPTREHPGTPGNQPGATRGKFGKNDEIRKNIENCMEIMKKHRNYTKNNKSLKIDTKSRKSGKVRKTQTKLMKFMKSQKITKITKNPGATRENQKSVVRRWPRPAHKASIC